MHDCARIYDCVRETIWVYDVCKSVDTCFEVRGQLLGVGSLL